MDQVERAAKLLLWYKDPSRFFKDIYNMEPYPYQSKVLNRIREGPHRMILCAAGGTGKTKLLACIALWLTFVLPKFIRRSYSVIIISGSKDQARYLYEYSKYAIQDNEIIRDEVEGEPLMSLTRFKDGSLILAVPNSLKAIQGKHTDCVIVDEGAIAGDFIIQDTLRIVSTSDRDLIILSGTPMVYSSVFVDYWEDTEKYREWERFSWTAKDCPKISVEKWEEAKKLPEDMFSVFWEGKPYAKVGTMISTDLIKQSSKDVPVPSPDHKYPVIAGIDWGYRHYTAIVVLQYNKDNNKINILYTDQWRREDFEDMHQKIVQICKEYNVSSVYCDAEDIGENQRLSSKGLNIVPVHFNQNKLQMQSYMKILFHQDKIRIPEKYHELISQLRKYNWNTKENDDLVDALQLALWGTKKESSTFYYEVL